MRVSETALHQFQKEGIIKRVCYETVTTDPPISMISNNIQVAGVCALKRHDLKQVYAVARFLCEHPAESKMFPLLFENSEGFAIFCSTGTGLTDQAVHLYKQYSQQQKT